MAFFRICGEKALLSTGKHKGNVLQTEGRDWLLGSQGHPIFPSGCEGKLGVALESLQGALTFLGRGLIPCHTVFALCHLASLG